MLALSSFFSEGVHFVYEMEWPIVNRLKILLVYCLQANYSLTEIT